MSSLHRRRLEVFKPDSPSFYDVPIPNQQQQSGQALLHLIVVVGTLPHYRFFEFNTLGAIKRIAQHCIRSDELTPILNLLRRWRQRKLAELQHISIAVSSIIQLYQYQDERRQCAILLGAVIGCFSWNTIKQAYWLAGAFWYISLLLSILGILLSAQQIAVLNFLGDVPRDSKSDDTQIVVDRYLPLLVSGSSVMSSKEARHSKFKPSSPCRPKKKMVFIWQCPIMFMSYSATSFLLGLTIFVITPLIRIKEHGWSGDAIVSNNHEHQLKAAC